jgi:hypothetical protein
LEGKELTNITKKQHQLHQGYARAYAKTGEDKDLVFYDASGKRSSLQSARSLSTEDYLYETRDTDLNQIEKWFSAKERKWTGSLRAANQDKPLSSDDHYNLIEFALLTALRQKETISLYHNLYKHFGEHNGEGIFKQSFGVVAHQLAEMWIGLKPTIQVVPLGSVESECFYLTSDNPPIFFSEDSAYQPLWTVPLQTFHGFFYPVSSTRLFVSHISKDLPKLLTSNNLLQRKQSREFVFTDKSKENLLISECETPVPDDIINIETYPIDQDIIMLSGIKYPVRGLIILCGNEIQVIPEGASQAHSVHFEDSFS